jgi:translocation and assembly module TamA
MRLYWSSVNQARVASWCFGIMLWAACAYAHAAAYTVRFAAPAELAVLLQTHTDLARFSTQDDVSAQEISRLISEAPSQMRDFLATEGYFNPQFSFEQRSTAQGVPEVRVTVQEGPRTTVAAVALSFDGPLTSVHNAPALQAKLRRDWTLAEGEPFRQAAWDNAKNALLTALWADRFPLARIVDSAADIDADNNQARVRVTVTSGPEFAFGGAEISGLQRVPDNAVRNLLTINPGDPYSQRALLDAQDKLRASGLFDSVAVDVDTDPRTASAAPIRIRLRERQFQRIVTGIGLTANTGARASVEYSHLQPFGLRWQSKATLSIAQAERRAGLELTSYPLAGLYRNLAAAEVTQSDIESLQLNTQRLRVGRTQDGERIERLYYLEVERAASTTEGLTNLTASALTANYQWVWRDVDSVVFPTQGLAVSAQAGVGTRFGGAFAGRPFSRVLARVNAYQPLGRRWFTQGRIEFGQVFADEAAGIPQSLLFRAGGDDSVRGYDYQSLGVVSSGAVIGGRVVYSASAEISTPISIDMLGPGWFAALFADVGDAADSRTALKRNMGYGIGARWRSPVGPLRIDVAYAERLKQFKLHVSIGIVF